MQVSLVQSTPNPIETIAQIASICYNSDPKHPMGLVKRLYKNGHHSVFEHIYFTFRIEGISRACSHQLVRHRMCAFTQRSQRYCNEANSLAVVPPSLAVDDEGADEIYKSSVLKARKAYTDLVTFHDVQKEDARYLLPNATQTDLYLSCNLRELIHIANERLCARAQWEIRMLVALMVEQVDENLRWMLVPKCESGFWICNNPCRKKQE